MNLLTNFKNKDDMRPDARIGIKDKGKHHTKESSKPEYDIKDSSVRIYYKINPRKVR